MVRLDKNDACCAAVCARLFNKVVIHTFENSKNYKCLRMFESSAAATAICLIYFFICARVIAPLKKTIPTNGLRAKLSTVVPCLQKYRITVPGATSLDPTSTEVGGDEEEVQERWSTVKEALLHRAEKIFSLASENHPPELHLPTRAAHPARFFFFCFSGSRGVFFRKHRW